VTSPADANGDERGLILRRGGSLAGVLALLGVGASAVMLWAFAARPERAFHSYLTAYMFALSILLGSLAFIMTAHAANATWPVAVRRLAEATSAAMPFLALLVLPLFFGIERLYPWARPSSYPERLRHILEHRRAFMNTPDFVLRACGYLVFWSLLALLLRHWSLAMNGEDERRTALSRRLSYFGLAAGSLTGAAAAFEWMMSLSPEFASTMFGAYWLAMCLFGGVAWVIVALALAQRFGFAMEVGGDHCSALGRLLLAFLIFLAYVAFFQFLLCWIANKPSEAEWYVVRMQGGHGWTGAFLIVGHAAIPFFTLLSFRFKRDIQSLAPLAVFCLVAQYLHLHWFVAPESKTAAFDWLDGIALLSILPLTSAMCIWLQLGKPMVAARDPRYALSLQYRSR
jgi:hypothetical protein